MDYSNESSSPPVDTRAGHTTGPAQRLASIGSPAGADRLLMLMKKLQFS